jgi:UDP-2,3-diacylglucosamine hydrolase
MVLSVGENSEYVNLGDWMNTTLRRFFDGDTFELETYHYSLEFI